MMGYPADANSRCCLAAHNASFRKYWEAGINFSAVLQPDTNSPRVILRYMEPSARLHEGIPRPTGDYGGFNIDNIVWRAVYKEENEHTTDD